MSVVCVYTYKKKVRGFSPQANYYIYIYIYTYNQNL
jgi:hypothetical protein